MQIDIARAYIEMRASGHPWMLVSTPDPDALLEGLARTEVPGLDCPVAVAWNLAGGHRTVWGDADLASCLGDTSNKPFMLLSNAAKLPAGAVVFLEVPSAGFWSSDICVSALRNLRGPFKSSNRTVVLVAQPGAGDKLPPQLEPDVPVVREERPDEASLRNLVAEVVRDNGIQATDQSLATAARSLRGMTRFAAENALARKCLTGTLLADQLAAVRRENIETSTGGALQFERSAATFDHVGGLAAFKDFGRRLFAGPEAPDLVVRLDELDKVVNASAVGAVADNTGVSQDMLRTLLCAIEDNGWLFGLLAGTPGAGKSLSTCALGNTFGRLTLAADLARCRGSLVGQSEAALRQVMDVIKALGGRKVLLLATCNRMDTLPPELLSRAGGCGVWFFDTPTPDQRSQIWAIQEKAHGLEPQAHPDDRGWVGRDIRNACRMARMLGCSLVEGAPYVMRTGVVSLDLVAKSRSEAEAKGYLDAERPGPYRIDRNATDELTAASGQRRTLAIVPMGDGGSPADA